MEQQILELTKLQIEFIVGTDQRGQAIIKRKTFSNIRESVDAASLKIVADAIASLQVHPVNGLKRLDTWVIA